MSTTGSPERTGFFSRVFESDLWHSFRQSWVTMIAAVVTAIIFLSALFAPIIAPPRPV